MCPNSEKKINKGQNTRRDIINSAAILFAKNGYNHTSLAEILEATDLTKGGFYFHFKSKEALGEAVLEALEDYWERELLPVLERGHDAQQRLETILQMPGDCLSTPNCLRPTVLLLNLATEMIESHTKFSQRIKSIYQNWLSTITSIIVAGQADGTFDRAIDATAVAGVIMSTIMGANLLTLLQSDPCIYQKQLSSLKTILLQGIGTGQKELGNAFSEVNS